jgi:transketolase
VDGNNINELCEAIDFALANKTDSPVMIVANTIKGIGIKKMAGDYKWHYGAINEDMYNEAKKDLEEFYKERCARAEKEGA